MLVNVIPTCSLHGCYCKSLKKTANQEQLAAVLSDSYGIGLGFRV